MHFDPPFLFGSVVAGSEYGHAHPICLGSRLFFTFPHPQSSSHLAPGHLPFFAFTFFISFLCLARRWGSLHVQTITLFIVFILFPLKKTTLCFYCYFFFCFLIFPFFSLFSLSLLQLPISSSGVSLFSLSFTSVVVLRGYLRRARSSLARARCFADYCFMPFYCYAVLLFTVYSLGVKIQYTLCGEEG